MTAKPLKLQAHDAQEIDIIAACLQDALVPVQGLHFQEETKQFLMFANRFKWETAPESKGQYERVHTGVSFSEVTHVVYKGFSFKENHHDVMNLLTIRTEKEGKEIRLIFSDNAEITLTTKKISLHLQDMSEPWPASAKPDHRVAEK